MSLRKNRRRIPANPDAYVKQFDSAGWCGLTTAAARRHHVPMTITIWHNPNCGTSRTVLATIRATGAEPIVVEYLKSPPLAEALAQVAAALGGAEKFLRLRGTRAAELGLIGADDGAIITAMAAEPALIERPVVITPKGIVLARPAEAVLAVL